MRLLPTIVAVIGIALLPHLANAQPVDDPFSDYLQRSQGVSLGAGNANEANEAIQSITPWPPYVGYRRIPTQGRHAADSIEQMYRLPEPFQQQGAGGAGAGASSAGGPQGSSPTGLPVTPMQPISSGF